MLTLYKTNPSSNDLPWFRQPRFIALTVMISCATLIGAGVWPLKLIPVGQADQQFRQSRSGLYEQVRAGVGREVRFASTLDSPERVRESVLLADRFIYMRSGMKMSNPTRERLIEMEAHALKGGPRISVDDFTNVLTGIALDRISSLTEGEIDYAAKTLLTDRGMIHTRASGGNYVTLDEFTAQARAARDGAQREDIFLQEGARSFIAGEVNSRVTYLGQALPESFGSASDQGLTPLQAFLIAYSIAAADSLSGSQGDLQQKVASVNQMKGLKGSQQDKAFGIGGRLFSTPLNLALNTQTIGSLLDRIEKGESK